MTAPNPSRQFPCPVCTAPQDVRTDKNGKPYLHCDPCGVQFFVRRRAGIAELEQLLKRAEVDGLLTRSAARIRQYYRSCPQCRSEFWIEPQLIKTSLFDGSIQGVRCPGAKCGAVLPWERAS